MLRITQKVPIFFHNLKGYDSKYMGAYVSENSRNNAIALSTEKFIKIDFGKQFHFVDTLNFVSSSLEQLVKDCKNFNYINEISDDDLLRKKMSYPYEYMDSFDRFDEEIPEKSEFFSSLTGEAISNEDYDRVHEICKEFELNNLGDLHDLYVKTDVLLLADVFENFRGLSMNFFKLDPCHFVS